MRSTLILLMDTFLESEMSEMMLSIFSGHVSLTRRKFAISPLNVLSSVCSTSASKHQFDFLWYFGQNVAKFTAKRHCSESVDVEDQGGYLFSEHEEKQTTFPPKPKRRPHEDSYVSSFIKLCFLFLCVVSKLPGAEVSYEKAGDALVSLRLFMTKRHYFSCQSIL